MPLDSPFPEVFVKDVPVHQYILDEIVLHGRATAFINSDTGVKYTFEDVYVQSRQIAHGLHANGFKHGDIVTMCTPNTPEYSMIILGVLSRGGVISSVNSVYTEEELERHFKDSTSKYIFTNKSLLSKVCKAADKLDKQIKKIYVIDAAENDKMPQIGASLSSLLKYAFDAQLPPVKIWTKTDLAFLPYSSGTTGWPKGVMISHYNMVAMLHAFGVKAFYVSPSKGDHIIGMLPFFHIYGLVMMLMAMKEACTMVTMSKFLPEKYLEIIQTYKVPILYVVPPILVFLAKDEMVNKYDISSVYACTVGAAPVGKELSLEVVERHPNIKYLIQGYGMTETGCASHVMPATPVNEVKHGSCGMVLPNMQCKVVDLETGKELGPNQNGEICMKGITNMLGYFNNEKATSEIYDADGWLHSGDIGYYDDEQFFYVIDRLKELIKVKGFQVPPAELEDLLLSHPEIKDAAVIGIRDLTAGEVPRAYVVREPGSKLNEKQINEYVDSKVAAFKRLKGGIEFIDEIPKSPAGKILRRYLREQFAAKQKNNAKL